MLDVKRAARDRSLSDPVSELTTARLSVYLRALDALESAGINTISSKGLAEQFHLNAAQIRKDLAYFGEFGVRGVGYYVKDLRRHLREILGFAPAAARDHHGRRQPRARARRLSRLQSRRLRHRRALRYGAREDGAVLARRRADSQRPRDRSAGRARAGRHCRARGAGGSRRRRLPTPWSSSGIKAILNFSPGTVRVPKGVKLKNVDLTVTLESLSFFLARGVDVPDHA